MLPVSGFLPLRPPLREDGASSTLRGLRAGRGGALYGADDPSGGFWGLRGGPVLWWWWCNHGGGGVTLVVV